MSFQGKKSVPRITVSLLRAPLHPSPLPPSRADRPGSAPSALPPGLAAARSSPGADPPAGFLPARPPLAGVSASASRGPFPEPDAQVPGHAGFPGPPVRPARARGPERPPLRSAEVPSLPALDGAEAGQPGLGVLSRVRRADVAFCRHRQPGLRRGCCSPRALLASSGPRLRPAGSSLSKTKRLSPRGSAWSPWRLGPLHRAGDLRLRGRPALTGRG